MIRSRQNYLEYLKADKIALNISDSLSNRFKRLIFIDYIWEFQKTLRKAEYYKNCKKGLINKIIYIILKRRLHNLSLKLGFSIPENVFGPGLAIVHRGTIVVNANARVGANCRIHICTNIGASGGTSFAPILGDNVYIAPGVKIYGRIRVADRVAFAANAAVNKDCLESDSLYGGVPAKLIGSIEIRNLIPHLRNNA